MNVLFYGKLEYQKGIDELIAVIKALKDDNRFYFHVVDGGSMKERLNQAIQNLTNVTAYQKIYGLSAYLSSFDYLFIPSNHEGLVLMSIEASLAHAPTIINACPELKDTLPDDQLLSVKNNSVEAFLNIFKHIENINYTALCDKAYQFASSHFSMEQMQQKIRKTIL